MEGVAGEFISNFTFVTYLYFASIYCGWVCDQKDKLNGFKLSLQPLSPNSSWQLLQAFMWLTYEDSEFFFFLLLLTLFSNSNLLPS